MRRVVVIPTYCEAGNIPELLGRIAAAMPDLDVLIVDDSSPDGTADLAAEAGVHVLRRPGREGLGVAYRAGFAWALAREYDQIGGMDADLSHDPAALPSLFAAVDAGAGLAIGSRYQPGGSIPDWPWHRRLLSGAGNRYARLMLGTGVRDATSGFRVFRAEQLRDVMSNTLRADGYGFLVECAYRVTRAGGVVREVPIVFRDRSWGTSKMALKTALETFRLVTLWGVRRVIPGL